MRAPLVVALSAQNKNATFPTVERFEIGRRINTSGDARYNGTLANPTGICIRVIPFNEPIGWKTVCVGVYGDEIVVKITSETKTRVDFRPRANTLNRTTTAALGNERRRTVPSAAVREELHTRDRCTMMTRGQ